MDFPHIDYPHAAIYDEPLSGKRLEKLSVLVVIPDDAASMTDEQLGEIIRNALLDAVPDAVRGLKQYLQEPPWTSDDPIEPSEWVHL